METSADRPLRVMFLVPHVARIVVGGGEIMAFRLAQELPRFGVAAADRVVDYDAPKPDVVHFFSVWCGDEFHRALREVRQLGIPYVVSPIFGFRGSVLRRGLQRLQIELGRRRLTRRERWGVVARLLEGADAVVAISEMERELLGRFFPFLQRDRVRTILLGAPEEMRHAEPDAFRREYGVEGDFIISVARLEPHKNQLALIRALHQSGKRLVLVGSPRHNPGYAAACRAAADANVRFVDRLPEPLLWSAYAGARVFALPSHYELFGLAALEAAAGGARVVCGAQSGVRECLRDRALYVDPASEADIRAKVLAAWDWPADRLEQQRFVLGEHSWRSVAGRFAEVYRECVRRAGEERRHA